MEGSFALCDGGVECLSGTDKRLLSNPSFTNGFLSDIEYVLAADDSESDATHDESNASPAETFSLIKLVTSIVKREITPVQKELEESKAANKLLEEEIKALKAERRCSCS